MQKDMTPKYEPPRSEGVQCTTEEEWGAITKSSRKNEEVIHSGNDTKLYMFLGGEGKVQFCKEQNYIGTYVTYGMLDP